VKFWARARAVRWAHERGRLALVCGAAGTWGAFTAGPASGGDLDALARSLGRSAGGLSVSSADIRWLPSDGVLADAIRGRPVLFLARPANDEPRDVWRARVRLSPEGGALEVGAAHNLTNTPLGDDHELVVLRNRAAFATRAYGQEQSLTLLDVAGEGDHNPADKPSDRAMAAITNLQRTGQTEGIGRVDVTLESSAAAVGLDLGEALLSADLYDGDPRRSGSPRRVLVDLARGDLATPVSGVRADTSTHLPKRLSHWVVDTLRAVPSIGPVPIAWVEDQALAMRDAYRRIAFATSGDVAVVAADAPPQVLDSSQASIDEAHWPPASVRTIWKTPEKGEGEWSTPGVAWLPRSPRLAAEAPSPVLVTFVRPDDQRPYSKVLLVAMDMRQLDVDMEAGVEDPEPLTGPHGPGRIPRDPAVYRRVLAAFNGAFKTDHGHYGMMVHKHVLLPPVPGSATVVVLDDGRVGFGSWGPERRVGGIEGIDDEAIVSFRQNLDPLVDHGQVNPTGRNLWGFTLPGKGAQTERSGLCVTTSGHLLYAWGDDVSATTLARAMSMGGCDFALHLDMNPYHTGFLFTSIEDLAAKKYKSQLLTPAMSIPVDRYIQYAPKDFFYVMVHDPTPPAVDGATDRWEPLPGTQPPPQWMPGLWSAHLPSAGGTVEVIDVEPGRATWRVRAGARESPASNPLREIAGEDAKRVLFAVGAGIALDKRPRGLATDGRLAVPAHGGVESGVLRVAADGQLTLMRASEAPATVDVHEDLLELPVVLWDGKGEAPLGGAADRAPKMRGVIGSTPSQRVLIARGVFDGDGPLVDALARAGCTRALALDRGAGATGFFDRAGTGAAPRPRYDESVVYAIAASLRPRGFRFDPSTLLSQGSQPPR
jgi:hypothetical protein